MTDVPTTYSYTRGETIQFFVEAIDDFVGSVGDVASVTAALKPAKDGLLVPDASVASVASFTATFQAAAGDVGPGWVLRIAPAASGNLVATTYITVPTFNMASGDVFKGDPVIIEVGEST